MSSSSEPQPALFSAHQMDEDELAAGPSAHDSTVVPSDPVEGEPSGASHNRADGDGDAPADGDDDNNEAGEEEEEYEIESILGHEDGRFVEGEMAYLVSWKDYGEEHNSWVRAGDAEGAQDMINEYWSRTPRKEIKRTGPAPRGRKKGKQLSKRQSSLLRSVVSPASTSKRQPRTSGAREGSSALGPSSTRTRGSQTAAASSVAGSAKLTNRGVEVLPSRSPSPYEVDEAADERLEEIANDPQLSPAEKVRLSREYLEQQKVEHMKKKYGRIADWDPIVRHISGIENIGGKVWAYLHFTSGDHVCFPLQVAEDRCPRQLNKFFIAHIRFKTTEGLKEYLAPRSNAAGTAAATTANGRDDGESEAATTGATAAANANANGSGIEAEVPSNRRSATVEGGATDAVNANGAPLGTNGVAPATDASGTVAAAELQEDDVVMQEDGAEATDGTVQEAAAAETATTAAAVAEVAAETAEVAAEVAEDATLAAAQGATGAIALGETVPGTSADGANQAV